MLVLATGSWPLQPPATNFSIPKELQACEQLFQKFYQAQHSGRKLNWLHQLSKGELKTRYCAHLYQSFSLVVVPTRVSCSLYFSLPISRSPFILDHIFSLLPPFVSCFSLLWRYISSAKSGYTLQASTYQMGILLQFNSEDGMRYVDCYWALIACMLLACTHYDFIPCVLACVYCMRAFIE